MRDLIVAGVVGGLIVVALQVVIVPGILTLRDSLRRRRQAERGQ